MRYLLFLSTAIALIACNDETVRNEIPRDTLLSTLVSYEIHKNDTLKPVTNVKTDKDSLNYRVLGIWAAIGEENATFEIKANEIYYPDQFASYKYKLVNDSMKIEYDNYNATFLVKMNGNDTLVFRGSDTQTYFRFKD